jgi:AAA domain
MSDIAIPQEIWDHELTASAPSKTDWLWQGFIAPGNTTLFTSHGKLGKTTLLSALLSHRKEGGTLAGLAVKPGRTVVVSEESREVWEDRARQFDFGGKVCFIFRPFLTIPRPEEWQALIERILALREQHGCDLVLLDPLAPFLRGENQARSIYETLLPLGALTRRGMAVTMAHHPGKRERPIGLAARGSTALLAHVDVSIEMRQPGGDPLTRRRRLVSLSRYTETPRRLLIELDARGTDYLTIADGPIDDYAANWDQLRGVLDDAPQKLTRRDILDEWPADYEKPGVTALRAWLDRAIALRLVACEGSGRKKDPFRYWLPEREAVWKQEPLYEVFEELRRKNNIPFESLRERKRKLGDDHEFSGYDTPLPASGFPDEREGDDE